MNYLIDPVNRGFIIAALMGLLMLLVAMISVAAPDLLVEKQGQKLSILRLPLIGFLLRLIGIGEIPILFLLGIYPFIIGIVGWAGNLVCLLWLNIDPTTEKFWWIIRLSGFFAALIFVILTRNFLKILGTTHTVALIPERLIGTSGEVLAILNNGVLQVSLYDEIGKFSLQIYALPWENATEKDFEIGSKVYLVDLLAPRTYSVVKLDSEDQLKVISLDFWQKSGKRE